MNDRTDKQLDQLLDAADWPLPEGDAVSRLNQHWNESLEASMLDEGSVEISSITPASIEKKRTERDSRSPNQVKWWAAVASLVLVGSLLWLISGSFGTKANPGQAAGGDETKQSPITDQNGKQQNQSEHNLNADSHLAIGSQPKTIPENQTPPNESPILSEGQFLQAIVNVQTRQNGNRNPRSVVNKPRNRAPSIDSARNRLLAKANLPRNNSTLISKEVAGKVADWLGRSTTMALAVQHLVRDIDATVIALKTDRRISRKQLAQYQQNRRAWEKWAWQYVESNSSRNPMAATRFALALSTDASIHRGQQLIQNPMLRPNCIQLIATFGNTNDIQKAIPATNDQRAHKKLLTSLLKQPNRQAALAFLNYLKTPATQTVALEIANSTDQLPTDIWMASIANLERSRWDAAFAVANVCDQRITEGLIDLAMQPSTSSTALIALMKSSCLDAKRFIAYAETDQQLAGSLIMARRKLELLNQENSTNETRGL